MKSPKLFWKLFVIVAVFQIGTVFAFVMLVTSWQEQQAYAAKGRRLTDAASLLKEYLPENVGSMSIEQRQKLASDIQGTTQMRLTLVAIDGTVLADSDHNPLEMENHRDRPELVEAIRVGRGNSKRLSTTINQDMMYEAARIDDDHGKPIGLVRVAILLSDVQAEISRLSKTLWMVAAIVAFAGLVLTYMVVAKAMVPILTLTRAANAMAAGRYQQTVEVTERDEIGQLAVSFNHMVEEIENRENELRNAAGRISAILGGMIEGVVAVDATQQVLFANEAAGRVLGFEPRRVQDKPLEAVGNASLVKLVQDCLRDTSAPSSDVRTVELVDEKNGMVLSVNAARLPGQPCPGVVLVMHNVTELRRLESLRQEFVANVSHELKTPLSAIMAYTETLQNGAAEQVEIRDRFIEQIQEQSLRLDELIHDMLALARIEAGQAPFEITTLCLSDIVEHEIDALQETAEVKQILLTVRGAPDITVLADDEALRQIIDNLVNNAIKYTGEGGEVDVNWQMENDRVILEISDTGIGIAPKHQARVFERFYRVDKARSRELGGTGLGLSIVKHLAQTLGGNVSLTSEVGPRQHVSRGLAPRQPSTCEGLNFWSIHVFFIPA